MRQDDESEDARLVRLSLGGDRAAFSGLMARHKGAVHRYVMRYVRDWDEAYDLSQETFISAWRALTRYDAALGAFDVWLRRIALNKCRDYARRQAVRAIFSRADATNVDAIHEIADPSPTSEAQILARERVARLDQAIQALPSGLRDSLILTTLEGLSHADAGRVLGLSAKAVEVRVYRARTKLAGVLKGEAG